MGKGVLLVVFAATLSYATINSSDNQSQFGRAAEEASYSEDVLARQMAHSGLNLVVSELTRDYSNFRSTVSSRDYRYGQFSYTASGDRQGPVSLTAYGEYAGSAYEITATMTRTGKPILDAVTTDGPISTVTANGSSFTISGQDADLDGDGTGPDGHAMITSLEASATELSSAIDPEQAIGKNGQGDIVAGSSTVDFDSLRASVLNSPDAIVLEGNQTFNGGDVFGSPEDPAVIVVKGDLDMRGDAIGYGMLLVEGSLQMRGSSRWEGMVMATTNGGDHTFKGQSAVIGGLVLRSLTSDGEAGGETDAGLLGGHFDVDVFDSDASGSLRYHEHQYDDKYDVTGLNILSSGCEVAGGLCWDELVSDSSLTNVRIELINGSAAAGSFRVQTTGQLQEGLLGDGFSIVTAPSDLIDLHLEFDSACEMTGSTPGSVWDDTVSRAGIPTVRVYDTAPEVYGSPAVMIYEMSVYRHTVEDECGEQVEVQPMSVYFNGDVNVQWSSDALARIDGMFPELKPPPVIFEMINIKERKLEVAEAL